MNLFKFFDFHKIIVNEPISFVFNGFPPDSFFSIQNNLLLKINNFPIDSAIYSRIKAFESYVNLLKSYSIQIQSPNIVKNNKGGVLFFHISPDPEKLLFNIKKNYLKRKPKGEVHWDNRCFGPRLACFTDPDIVKKQLIKTNLNINNIVCIESFGMNTEYEVVVKDAYREFMICCVRDFIYQNKIFKTDFERIKDILLTKKGLEILNKIRERLRAFFISGLVIDLYCYLNPSETRLGYRIEIQKNFKNGIPFGYRTFTDRIFKSNKILMETVLHMLEYDHVSPKQKIKIVDVIMQFLNKMNYKENDYIGLKYFKKMTEEYFESFLIHRLLIRYDDELFKFLFENNFTSKNTKLLKIFDGWFPINETEFVFQKNEGFGTDMGSNNIATIARFDNKIHRIVRQDELRKFFN